MGLDMMLYGIKRDKKEDVFERSSGTWEEVCYWRKTNQVHKWFSDRFIKDQNPWGYYEVEEKDLQGLLLICKLLKHVKENPDDELLSYVDTKYFDFVNEHGQEWELDGANLIAYALLPPDNVGCFFGSGVVDEWYWNDIEDTIEQLTKALEGNYDEYFYMASW